MIVENLKIALIQYPIFWEEKEKNFDYLDSKISTLPEDIDILVLPEMFNTGFTMQSAKFAESMNGKSIEKLKYWSKLMSICICGSLIIEEDGKFFNRLIWVDKNQNIQTYDKRHLFGLGEEDKNFSPGKDRLIVEEKGWKICPMICYDLRFPVWTRNINAQYDLLIFVANWPSKRIHHWNALIPARAIENQSYVVAVNRIGKDGNAIEHNGQSQIVHPNGDVLIKSEKEEILIFNLEEMELKKNRRIFPFLKDMDSFSIDD